MTNRPRGTVDAHPAISVEESLRAERRTASGNGPSDTTDMIDVFRAIAARIDVVLDASVAADSEPGAGRVVARARSSTAGRRGSEPESHVTRHALSTQVFRMSADGGLDVDERPRAASDDAGKPARVAMVPVPDDAFPSPVPLVGDRADVELSLRAVRERLVARRARATARRADAPVSTPRHVRSSGWRGSEIRTLIRRVLIGIAIVGASAVVSVLVT